MKKRLISPHFGPPGNCLMKNTFRKTVLKIKRKSGGAIQGLVSSLGDPYSVFLPPAETEMFESDISGNFEGVGMEIGIRDKILTVIAPLKGTPAEKAGVLPGDKIIKIDETGTVDLSVDKAVKLIRGKKGTTVKLSIIRGPKDEALEISVTRDTINIPTIDTEIKNDVFIIRLYNFSANSPGLFRESLREFAVSGKDKLILDLRGNPGGYLEAAVDMASWFLPAGKVIVREDFGKKAEPVVYRSKGYDVFNENLENGDFGKCRHGFSLGDIGRSVKRTRQSETRWRKNIWQGLRSGAGQGHFRLFT